MCPSFSLPAFTCESLQWFKGKSKTGEEHRVSSSSSESLKRLLSLVLCYIRKPGLVCSWRWWYCHGRKYCSVYSTLLLSASMLSFHRRWRDTISRWTLFFFFYYYCPRNVRSFSPPQRYQMRMKVSRDTHESLTKSITGHSFLSRRMWITEDEMDGEVKTIEKQTKTTRDANKKAKSKVVRK